MIPLVLSGSVGYDEDNDPNDVARTGNALAVLGLFDALEAVQSGKFGDSLDGAIRTYQSENNLDADGVLLPNGPTQNSLNDSLREHRPGPSLLPAEDEGPSGVAWPRNSAAQARTIEEFRGEDLAPSLHRVASAKDQLRDLPAISKQAARNLAKAQGISGRGDVFGGAIASLPIGRAVDAVEQIMKTRGFRYVPDPMGRVDEGDWVNERGDRIGSDEAHSIARQHQTPPPRRTSPDLANNANVHGTQGVTVVAARASAPARRIESTFQNLAYDLDTAAAYVKRGEGDVRVAVSIRSSATSQHPADEMSRINAGIREAVVANALLNRPTSPEEIASITRDIAQNQLHGSSRGRSRVKDMLTEAALNAATPDQRLHARGLLAVYEMEEREAKAAGRPDPRGKADSAIAAFAAGLNGEVPWSVHDPEEGEDGDEDEDHDVRAEHAADDPDNPRRPRGMHNERTREAAREGKRRHDELKERVLKREDRGWHKDGYKVNGRWYFPDATTRRGYLLELKPDTPSGRAAGAKQCAEYTRVTGKRCRVIYYQPNSSTGSRGGAGTPKLTRPWGVGSNRLGNPKLPRTPWDLLE